MHLPNKKTELPCLVFSLAPSNVRITKYRVPLTGNLILWGSNGNLFLKTWLLLASILCWFPFAGCELWWRWWCTVLCMFFHKLLHLPHFHPSFLSITCNLYIGIFLHEFWNTTTIFCHGTKANKQVSMCVVVNTKVSTWITTPFLVFRFLFLRKRIKMKP